MPGEVKELLPARVVFLLPLVFFAASIFARLTKQKAVNDGHE